MKRIDALELEKLDNNSKNQNRFSDLDNVGHHDDLAEMDGISGSDTDLQQQIEDLQHEILILQKSNEMLKSGQSTDKQELLSRIQELE